MVCKEKKKKTEEKSVRGTSGFEPGKVLHHSLQTQTATKPHCLGKFNLLAIIYLGTGGCTITIYPLGLACSLPDFGG